MFFHKEDDSVICLKRYEKIKLCGKTSTHFIKNLNVKNIYHDGKSISTIELNWDVLGLNINNRVFHCHGNMSY